MSEEKKFFGFEMRYTEHGVPFLEKSLGREKLPNTHPALDKKGVPVLAHSMDLNSIARRRQKNYRRNMGRRHK